MAVGDEIGLSEDLYQKLCGRYVSAIEVLTLRAVAKDQHIAKLETQLAQLEAAQATDEPKEGDVIYLAPGEEPPAPAPKGKKK
jgi:hypothetical protein